MNFKGLESYQIKYSIGKGGFAQVYYAIHKLTGSKVAIKIISKKDNNEDGKQLQRIQREIEIMKKINHPFIASLFEVIENENNICIVMEYVQNGTLLNQINEDGPLKEENAAIVFAELLITMKYLMNNFNICHRDIKAENILFDANYNIRLIDFGLSNYQITDSLMKTQCGSPCYASPEMIMGKEYSVEADVWSAGVLLYAMIYGFLPFEDPSITKLAQKIVYKDIELPNDVSTDLADLIKKLLIKDQKNRITIDEALAHPWLKNAVRKITDEINKFKFNNESVKKSLIMYGFNLDAIDKDLKSNTVNQGTVSFNMVRREYFLATFPALYKTQEKHPKVKCSIHDLNQVLPRLDVRNKTGGINRASVPTQQATPIILSKRRHCQSPVIHIPL